VYIGRVARPVCSVTPFLTNFVVLWQSYELYLSMDGLLLSVMSVECDRHTCGHSVSLLAMISVKEMFKG
jgi:hypothetical protein